MTTGWPPTTARNRVNPPLREATDAEALRQALVDGVIDCVATDHAPHAEHEKMCEFANAGPACSACRPRCRWWSRRWCGPGLLDAGATSPG